MRKRKKRRSYFAKLVDSELLLSRQWCAGRNCWVRLPLLVLMVYVFIGHMRDPLFSSVFKGLDLGLHELGHYLFAPFGEFMHVAGGSLFQCLVPVIAMVMFRKQRDFFGIAFAFGWLSINLFEVATYAADARSQDLPLVSPGASGDEIIHDWNWLLSHMHLLQFDQVIAQFLRFGAILSMGVCLLYGGWLCFVMFRSRGKTVQST